MRELGVMTESGRPSPDPRRVFVLGATGTIGRATVRALARRGHDVVCFTRSPGAAADRANVSFRQGDATDPASLVRDGFRGERFDALVSCMASRTGAPADAWAIDHRAHAGALAAARASGVDQMVLLSAICVQKPLLAFQQAKLAFERQLMESGLDWSIVRPTAYYPYLAISFGDVKNGAAYRIFDHGEYAICNPIAREDLAEFLVNALLDDDAEGRILPVGGRRTSHA